MFHRFVDNRGRPTGRRSRGASGRPASRCRRRLLIEQLEERALMDAAGFIHTDPQPDPVSVVGVAGIEAHDDYAGISSGTTQLRIDVLANDPLPEGAGSLHIKSVSATARGATVAISEDGRRIIYTPLEGGVTYDSFYYIVESNDGKLGKANVTIGDKHAGNVYTPPPSEPTRSDWYDLFEDGGETTLNVLANDGSFRNGEIIEVTSARLGTVRIADDGRSLVYHPNPAVIGCDYFTYTVRRQDGVTATASVYVDISKPYEINYDGDGTSWMFARDIDTGPHTFNLLANDRVLAPTPEQPRIVDIQYPDYVGELRISEDGQSVVFTPAEGFLGTFDYTYTVRYGPLAHQTVGGYGGIQVRNTFLAVDNWFAVDVDSPGTVLDVLANDPTLRRSFGYSPLPDVTLTIIAATTGSQGGQVTIAADGKTLQYTPAAGFSGDETFNYVVEDSNGHGDSATVTVHVAEPVVTPPGLPKFFLPGELEQFLLDRAVEKCRYDFGVSQLHWLGYPDGDLVVAYDCDVVNSVYGTTDAGLDRSHSETNTQEAGVDEADIVETDGRYLYTFSDGKLVIADLRKLRHPRLASFTELDDRFTEMYLQGDRLTLLDRGSSKDGKTTAVVMVLDISNHRHPTVVERTEIDGRIIDSRAVGDRVYVAVSGLEIPGIEYHVADEAGVGEGYEVRVNETLDQYVARVHDSIIEASLPVYRTYGPGGELISSGVLTDPTDIHQPIDCADNSLVSLVTFDAGDSEAGPLSSTGIFTNTASEVYMSGDSFYVLRNHGGVAGETAIFKFQVNGDGSSELVATGKVGGLLLNQFSVDEHDGRLRIATTQTITETVNNRPRQQRRFNNLFVLEQHGTQLDVVGSIENLAPTETIKSVRFLDDRAYVVTFRVIDPLFAVDLSDPTQPTVEGALKIPGFSDYLHPVGEDYVIGIGYDANEITGHVGPPQISLFYVGDLAHPTLVDQVTMDGVQWASTEASCDHHAVAYFAEHQVLTIPVSWTESSSYERHSAIWAFQIDVDGSGGGAIDVAGSVEHDGIARRSVRIGEALITVSEESIKINRLHDPTVQISELYMGPLLEDDVFTIQEDSGASVLDVRANDHPGSMGQPPRIIAVTQPADWGGMDYMLREGEPTSSPAGVVEIIDHGRSLQFTPGDDFFGTVSFTYTVFDAVRGEQTATVTVHVENVPEDPDAVDDQFQVEPGSTAVAIDVLVNDVDAQRDYTASPISPVYTRGEILITPTIFAPATAIPILNRVIIDEATLLGLGGMEVLQPPDNPPPVFALTDLTITEVGPTSHGGTVEIDQSGRGLVYTPAAGFIGIDTFTYTIATTAGRTDTATVSVYVGVPMPIATLMLAEGPERLSLERQETTGPEQAALLAADHGSDESAQRHAVVAEVPFRGVNTRHQESALRRLEDRLRMPAADSSDSTGIVDPRITDLALADPDLDTVTGLDADVLGQLAGDSLVLLLEAP